MPNLSKVDSAHQDLHEANTALEQAMDAEASAQATVDSLNMQLQQAEADLAQKTTERQNLEAEYNARCDDLSEESLSAKVNQPAGAARYRT